MSPTMPSASTSTSYEAAVRSTWAPLRIGGGPQELVRYATLAANSHNTQPWKFTVGEHRITIAPDFARRCPAVDPDDHHLFASLGCAAENLTHAAAAAGLKATPVVEADAVAVMLERAPPLASALFDAIPRRQSTRAAYDGKPVANEALRLLEQAGTGAGISVIVITERSKIANVLDCVVEGNTAQMRDKAFMDELKSWLRFSEADAVATMDGLSARASGNPELPAWLARLLLPLVFTESTENDKYRARVPAVCPAGHSARAEACIHQPADRGAAAAQPVRFVSRPRRARTRSGRALRCRARATEVFAAFRREGDRLEQPRMRRRG